jgi:hypothetical protein
MKLKSTETANIDIEVDGTICIEQFSRSAEMPVAIYLTLEQFAKIEHWVFKNKDQIELLWNEGVEDDSNS